MWHEQHTMEHEGDETTFEKLADGEKNVRLCHAFCAYDEVFCLQNEDFAMCCLLTIRSEVSSNCAPKSSWPCNTSHQQDMTKKMSTSPGFLIKEITART